MLTFDRPAFRSGVMVVKVTTGDPAVESAFSLRPGQKGDDIDFGSEAIEAALLVKYSAFFTAVP